MSGLYLTVLIKCATLSEAPVRSLAATVLFVLVALSAPAWSQGAPDYSKRAAPLEAALKSALVGKWTNPVDHLIVDITDIDLMSGKISGNISPTTGPAAGDAHEIGRAHV